MNELLKANPDYDTSWGNRWGKKWIYRGKITKAIVILESETFRPDEIVSVREDFFPGWDGDYICSSHKGNVKYIKTKLKELKKEDNYLFITPDIALLANRIVGSCRETGNNNMPVFSLFTVRTLDCRPDNIFFLKDGNLRRMDKCTDRALRKDNNLFGMYMAGEFEE